MGVERGMLAQSAALDAGGLRPFDIPSLVEESPLFSQGNTLSCSRRERLCVFRGQGNNRDGDGTCDE